MNNFIVSCLAWIVNSMIQLTIMVNANQQGPTGNRLAANIRSLRKQRGYDLKDVSRWLSELRHPININGLSKIETGQRRVDVDDLVALALVLGATPDRLIIGPAAGDERLELTPGFTTSARRLWGWVLGDRPLKDEDARAAWRSVVRPDSPELPGIRIPHEGRQNPVVKEALDLFARADAEGLDPNGLVALYELTQPVGDSDG